MTDNQEPCPHIWVYDGKQGSDIWKICTRCGQTRLLGPYAGGRPNARNTRYFKGGGTTMS